ncbi:MAG: 3'-5' exonuclease domain-containing protein 2 [Paludibacteraceae bacterium]|nr:3'-5' exonuclease domain-containing protein 2 [Paludibacteraceae bacterium]MBP9039090.1 3'-5' exonuclease domain-containing protein 2 [Paludibacteraceae bacterium]OQC33894.1 MAG: Ribonuclease D [Bacteroidetes bacterium ADurb.Bin057]HHT61966.1 3'-5' exonuclease domain-containing protein 2 [Bacteroidales bacterium]
MKIYPAHITKEAVNALPILTIQKKIQVINNCTEADRAVKELMQCEILGFDTETKPSFKKGERNKIALLQLATDDKCYLFRLNKIGACSSIKKILESDSVLKIGLSTQDDFHSLNKWMRTTPRNFIELQTYVKAFGISEMSLQKIYAIIFGKKISKTQQLSNWEAPSLTPAQQLYAATDAWACRSIYLELKNNL